MSETKNDGGPAFPNPNFVGSEGMSLRDWFAGQALNGLTTGDNEPIPLLGGQSAESAIFNYWASAASVAYVIADAMLAARERQP